MICFCWSGFPQYAARCVKACAESTGGEVMVVATRPRVPIRGMEEICGCRVEWIGMDERRPLAEIAGEQPKAVFATGWHIEPFNRYCRETREHGGKAICMCDNNKTEGLVEWLKGWRFRLLIRNRFDGFMVPGASGRKLLEGYGVAPDLIREGMYSADSSLFRGGAPLGEREKRILYVGQFSARKNVRRMCEAFRMANREKEWKFDLYGCGPVDVAAGDGIDVHPFAQPEELAEIYRKARVFCLASVEEHWGLVVHEAALSGCILALSERVGAADDLAGEANGVIFNPYSTSDIARKLRTAMEMDGEALKRAEAESLERAGRINLGRFAEAVEDLK